VPLSESGTGVGQVLAILYVVFTSEYPRTIVIDEPQSFLHPGAVRKLFEARRVQVPEVALRRETEANRRSRPRDRPRRSATAGSSILA